MPLIHHRWLWLLATALAAVSLAATTALASDPDEDDEDDGDTPAQVLPAQPTPAAPVPAAPAPAAPAPAATAPIVSAPVVRGAHRTHRVTPRRSQTGRHVAARPVVHAVRTGRRQHTRGAAVRIVPRGGVQAGGGGMAAALSANPR
jgi:hypothetical protein